MQDCFTRRGRSQKFPGRCLLLPVFYGFWTPNNAHEVQSRRHVRVQDEDNGARLGNPHRSGCVKHQIAQPNDKRPPSPPEHPRKYMCCPLCANCNNTFHTTTLIPINPWLAHEPEFQKKKREELFSAGGLKINLFWILWYFIKWEICIFCLSPLTD